MKGYKKTDLGQVVIDPKVVVAYASEVVYSTPGIVGMAFIDAKDGIAKLLKREAGFKGIKVIIEDNKVTIDYHLIIKFGVNVLSVQQNLLDSVKYKIEHYTGLEVERVNMCIDGVLYGKKSKGGVM